MCGGAADSGEEVPVCVRSISVAALADADYSFPSMGIIRDRQNIYTGGKAILDSSLGSVLHGENGLYRVDYGEMQVIWVPPTERSLQVRLMVRAPMEAGHRRICDTTHQLGAYCVWEGIQEEAFSPEMMQKSVAGCMTIQDELRREVLERVRPARDRKHVTGSAGSMPNFKVGNYVLMARVRKLGSAPKLLNP